MPVETSAATAGSSFWRDFGAENAASAIVGFLFAATGPVAIILAAGGKGGLGEEALASWLFGAFFFPGLISIGFSLVYRQPLVFFWTIPGAVLVGASLPHLTMPEVVGAYLATGILMAVLGMLGWVRTAMAAIPMPVVMGMVAGVFLQFGLDWVLALRDGVAIAAPMTAAFLILSAVPALAARIPPLLAALVAGAAAIFYAGGFSPGLEQAAALVTPKVEMPAFSVRAMVELVIPLAITVLVVQNGQGVAVLTAAGHKPPVNAIAVACGAGSIAAAFVGAVSTCLTGPVNAILAAGGEKNTQYTAGVVVGVLALAFGIFSPLFTRLLLTTPSAFIATLAGLAMLRVLQSAFAVAFQGRFTLGALVTFLVTVAGVPVLNIGAPFWALIAGTCVSLLLERSDWRSSTSSTTSA